MRWTDMYVAGTGACLPHLESTETAVAQGRYDRDEWEQNGYVTVSVAHDESAVEMGVAAARDAVRRAGVTGTDIAVVLHAGTYHQGQDHWTPASYTQQQTVGGRAPAIEVKQASNGGLAAMILGLMFMAADPSHRGALIVAADKFCPPVYDRYRSDKWVVFGDGAGAMVLSRDGGFARVAATAMDADPELEELYRGTEGFNDTAFTRQLPLDMRSRKKQYLSKVGFEFVAHRASLGLANVISTVLADAKTEMSKVSRLVLPNVGRALMQWEFLDLLGIEESRTLWQWGSTVGHVGAADQLAGLNELVEKGSLRPGDKVLLASSGIGFNWNAALLEICETPKVNT